jgi:hypothetical protein
MRRGQLQFKVTPEGDLVNTVVNVEALRALWLHRSLVEGDDLGPGDRGDFDCGAWHVACHIAGAGGIRRAADGSLMWLEISHRAADDDYYASVTRRVSTGIETIPVDSAEGRVRIRDSKVVGFVEGSSLGRVSSRGVIDPPDRFNSWRRQDFDQPIDSVQDGGKVWEHWCTLRDIRASHRIGTSMLTALISLASALGDRFLPTVARGRRKYGHPVQLAASVHAGLIGREAATWETTPAPIPAGSAALLLESQPSAALQAIEALTWDESARYYMYERKIRDWSVARDVDTDIRAFTAARNVPQV